MNNSKLSGSGKIRRIIGACIAVSMLFGTQISYLSASAEDTEVRRIYVSPDSTGGDGSSSNPVNSIEKALDLARAERDSMASGTVEIVLKPGTYRIEKTITINNVNSGNENVQIAIVGEEGGKAKITNSILLPNDKFEKVSDQAVKDRIPDAAKNNIYCINLKSVGIQNVGDRGRLQNATTTLVVMNDEKFVTAKWPNNSEELVGGIGRALLGEITVSDDAAQTYGFTADVEKERMERWMGAEDATIFGNFEYGYTTAFMDIRGLDPEKQNITMGGQQLVFKNNGYWWIENLIEELDQPGEFYVDRTNGILYLYPNGDISTAEIEYSAADNSGGGMNHIFTVTGASNFRIENVWIENSLGMSVNCDWQSNDIIIKNCRMRNANMGVYSQAPGTIIEGCDIYNMSEGGITAYAGNRSTLTPGRMVVTNNHIHKTNQGRRLGWVMTTEGVDNVYSHNLLHDAPHAAINYGGNGNKIEYNEIYDVIQDTTDAGTIYGGRTWSAYGNVIQYNYIHDIRHWQGTGGSVSIYLDDMISGIEVKNNIIQRTAGYMLIGGGHDNVVTNNIFLDGLDTTTDALVFDARGYGTHGQSFYTNDPENSVLVQSIKAVQYDSDIWLEKYPGVAAVLEAENPIDPYNNLVSGNLAANWSMMPYNQIANEVKKSGTVENNHMTMKKLSYEYNDMGVIEFTKPEEFDEFEGVEWFDTSTIGLLGGGNYDIPLERQTYADYAVDLQSDASNVTLVDYPDKVIDAVDLLSNPANLEMTEDGSVTASGSNYIVTGQVGYKAEKFDNFVLRYKYKMSEGLGSSQVYIRALTPIGDCWTGNYSYNFWLKPDSFETQRWNPASTMIAVSSDAVWRPNGEWNNIEFVFDNLDNGSVAIYVNINGHTVSSTQDNNVMKVSDPGYIMFGAPGGSVEIGKYDPSLNTADQTYLDQNKEIQDILDQAQDNEEDTVTEPVENPVRIVLDGKELETDTAPYIKNDRTYVPVRTIFEALGAQIDWNDQSRGVSAFYNNNRMYIGINDTYAVLNGEKIETDSPAEIVNDRTMAGVRFVSEMFGCQVDWIGESRIVQIKTQEYLQQQQSTAGNEETEQSGETEQTVGDEKASVKYNDKGNVLLFHSVPQLINYSLLNPVADGLLDKTANVESLIDFNKVEENYYLREGLLNVKTKLNNQTDRTLNVVFLGGSITEHDGYRNHICDWLSEQFGENRFNFINSGYGGTGSEFGKNRFWYDVASYDPDLIFVEFAVNDSSQPAKTVMQNMESIVRQALNYNSTTQIVFVYTFCPGSDVEQAAAGKWTNMAKIMDYVAANYGIPSIFIGADAAIDIQEGRALGKKADQNDTNMDLPLYSEDGVHPSEAGSLRYFDTIRPFLEELLVSSSAVLDNMSDGEQIPYLFKDSAGDRVNFSLDNYIEGEGMKKETADTYAEAYEQIENVYTSDIPGEGVTFSFIGTQAGIITLSGPDSGQVDVYVDGELVNTQSAWHPIFSNGSETPYAISTPILENGEHTVSFKVSDKIYDKIQALETVSPTQVEAYESIGDAVLNSTKIIFESGWVNGTMQ